MIQVASLILAQSVCMLSHDLYQALSADHGEERVVAGLSGQAMFEFWSNPQTGSWTILQTTPDGTSCVMSVGDNAVEFKRKPNI